MENDFSRGHGTVRPPTLQPVLRRKEQSSPSQNTCPPHPQLSTAQDPYSGQCLGTAQSGHWPLRPACSGTTHQLLPHTRAKGSWGLWGTVPAQGRVRRAQTLWLLEAPGRGPAGAERAQAQAEQSQQPGSWGIRSARRNWPGPGRVGLTQGRPSQLYGWDSKFLQPSHLM